MGIQDPSTWLVQVLRFTAFPQYNDRAKEEGWWEVVVGAPADSRTIKPKENLFQDDGEFGDGRLSLAIRPGRVDWVWSANVFADLTAVTIPSLGSFPKTLGTFRETIDKWVDIAPPLVRLAFGTILDQQAQDKLSTYNLLQSYLPAVKLTPESSSDFVYQINRPRNSQAAPGYTINRISKWMGMRGVISVNENGVVLSKEFNVARLEIDASSQIDANVPIEKSKVQPLLHELIGTTEEIIRTGDKP